MQIIAIPVHMYSFIKAQFLLNILLYLCSMHLQCKGIEIKQQTGNKSLIWHCQQAFAIIRVTGRQVQSSFHYLSPVFIYVIWFDT